MRRLVKLVLSLGVVAAVLGGADLLVRHQVQSALAARIDAREPGARAAVTITSFPFVGHLAASGTIGELSVHATRVTDGPLILSVVDLDLHRLRVRRRALVDGRVELAGLGSGDVTAVVTQGSIDRLAHSPITLGQGTVGLGGAQVPARVTVEGGSVRIQGATLPAIALPVPVLALLPCVSLAAIVPGGLQLSCSLSGLPPALAGASARF